ncbi:hypothetical protein ANN_27158 [Periplaneta americana]|uniref:Uncharacterized protein n=1 Tax=Periplaneta americana TaxID=6978 RepID=A0ABQ8RXB0_PERAM|nr:hypothetical protein ANN_27158 [Periplaneta americana]
MKKWTERAQENVNEKSAGERGRKECMRTRTERVQENMNENSAEESGRNECRRTWTKRVEENVDERVQENIDDKSARESNILRILGLISSNIISLPQILSTLNKRVVDTPSLNNELANPPHYCYLIIACIGYLTTTRLFSVDEIGNSQMVFGEMSPKIRRRLLGIHLMVGENLGKNPTRFLDSRLDDKSFSTE